MLALVELAGYERRPVTELSGGEQQRVALARSLAPGPRLLMLDEPLGALDRTLREQLMNELRAILKRVGVTALYVTHDQEEAFAMADRVLIMRARLDLGRAATSNRQAHPHQVYRQPASPFVARFLGFRNLLQGAVLETATTAGSDAPGILVATPLGVLHSTACDPSIGRGDLVTVLVRPEAAAIRPAGASGPNVVPGTLLARSFRGSFYLIRTRHADNTELTCEAAALDGDMPEPGAPLALWLDPHAITILGGQEPPPGR